jgi:hypothetical protein
MSGKTKDEACCEDGGSGAGGVHYANHCNKRFQLTRVRRYCALIARTIRPLLHKPYWK